MAEVPVHFILLTLTSAAMLTAADPTFLRRSVGAIEPKPDDLTAGGAKASSYKPIFGIGDKDARRRPEYYRDVAKYA